MQEEKTQVLKTWTVPLARLASLIAMSGVFKVTAVCRDSKALIFMGLHTQSHFSEELLRCCPGPGRSSKPLGSAAQQATRACLFGGTSSNGSSNLRVASNRLTLCSYF